MSAPLEKMLESLEFVRELTQDDEELRRFRGVVKLLRSQFHDRETFVSAYVNGRAVAVVHPLTYHELRLKAVETLKLIPFPTDDELAMLIFIGCLACEVPGLAALVLGHSSIVLPGSGSLMRRPVSGLIVPRWRPLLSYISISPCV